jgi:hypothetical protein
VIDRGIRRLMWIVGGGTVALMLIGVGVGVAPFIFSSGKSCGDPRGHPHRGLYTTGSRLCRQSGGTATLSVCGADGRWSHSTVERCF